jgi:phage gpG-like protein
MSKSNKFDLKQVEKKARKAMEAAIVDVGNTAKVFFVDSFRKQGWDDQSVQKWKARKRKSYNTKSGKKVDDTTRAILVKTGDLRRSIKRNPANRAALSIKISTDLPYAKIHNDGGTINRAGFKGLMYYREVATNLATRKTQKRFARTKGMKSRKATHAMEIDVKAFAINMPKRQFMGDSYNLNEKVKAVIVKRLDKVFT